MFKNAKFPKNLTQSQISGRLKIKFESSFSKKKFTKITLNILYYDYIHEDNLETIILFSHFFWNVHTKNPHFLVVQNIKVNFFPSIYIFIKITSSLKKVHSVWHFVEYICYIVHPFWRGALKNENTQIQTEYVSQPEWFLILTLQLRSMSTSPFATF